MTFSQLTRSWKVDRTYEGLEVEEEHADDTVTRAIKLEEVDEGILETNTQND